MQDSAVTLAAEQSDLEPQVVQVLMVSVLFLVVEELVSITLKNLCMHVHVCQRPSTRI